MEGEVIYPLSKVDPGDTRLELKCVVVKPVLRYLEDRLGSKDMRRIIAETGMNLGYLEDSSNWVSYAYFTRLLARVVQVTGDPQAPFEAARKYTDIHSYRIVGGFLRHLGTPREMYVLVVRFHTLWTKVNDWRLEKIGRRSCTICVRPRIYPQDKNNCLAVQGSLATVPCHFGLPAAEVFEERCACDGSEECVYRIRWMNPPRRLGGIVMMVFGVILGCIAVAVWGVHPETVLLFCTAALGGYFMGRERDHSRSLKEMYKEAKEQAEFLLEAIHKHDAINERLQEEVEARTQELRHANEVLERAMEDLKESREKALAAERHAAIGVLAAGMAHELNSPVNAIRLSVQSAMEDLERGGKLYTVLENAERATGRCRRIVNDLLAFAREPQLRAKVDIVELVDAAAALFEKETPQGVKIKRCVEGDIPTMTIDRAQMRQVIMNILYNASESMGGHGKIDIVVARRGDEVVISISDNGPGMSEEVKRHVFEPFFSTKVGPLRGTGLGLSISRQLVERNGGELGVESRPGYGTTFTIKFPAGVRQVRAEGQDRKNRTDADPGGLQ